MDLSQQVQRRAMKTGRGLAHLSYEKSWGTLGCSAWRWEDSGEMLLQPFSDGERLFTKPCSDRTRGNSFKLKEGKFTLNIRKRFFMMRWWWGTGPGCPEKLWMPHPLMCSMPGWSALWATWSSGRCPCPWQEGWTRWSLKVPSNPKQSMILWWKTVSERTSALWPYR